MEGNNTSFEQRLLRGARDILRALRAADRLSAGDVVAITVDSQFHAEKLS